MPDAVIHYMRKSKRRISDIKQDMDYNTNKLDEGLHRCGLHLSKLLEKEAKEK